MFSEINKNLTFESFISIDTNLNEKKIAQSFSKGELDEKVIFIASTCGNGATHLANAIINEIKYSKYDYLNFSYEKYLLLKSDYDISSLFDKLRNCKKVILIDSFSNNDVEKERQILDVLSHSKAKIIITGSHKVNLQINHLKIELVNVCSQIERQLIIEKLIKRNQSKLSSSIIKQISEINFDSVRELESFVTVLIVKNKLDNKFKIDKDSINQLLGVFYKNV
ncbi:MAG: hypothetical protein FGM14_06980 [Flavobacteriales bacterium]|nr:hypothetical protein [Flavobacteriales bacterium]